MVARINIAIVLYYSISTAGRSICTCARLDSAISGKCSVKKIDEILYYIIPDPLIKYFAHESAKAL
jgi:hypothetical protein